MDYSDLRLNLLTYIDNMGGMPQEIIDTAQNVLNALDNFYEQKRVSNFPIRNLIGQYKEALNNYLLKQGQKRKDKQIEQVNITLDEIEQGIEKEGENKKFGKVGIDNSRLSAELEVKIEQVLDDIIQKEKYILQSYGVNEGKVQGICYEANEYVKSLINGNEEKMNQILTENDNINREALESMFTNYKSLQEVTNNEQQSQSESSLNQAEGLIVPNLGDDENENSFRKDLRVDISLEEQKRKSEEFNDKSKDEKQEEVKHLEVPNLDW